MTRHLRSLAGTANTAEIRSQEFRGSPHLVVPVVALVGGGVVKGLGSLGAEFVPVSVLERAPGNWNGRPVIPNHPVLESGQPISVNTPPLLEALKFGEMHNTHVEDGNLKTEAWLDVEAAKKFGGDAAEVVANMQAFMDSGAGEMVEVSVSAIIPMRKQSGTNGDGRAYEYVWSDVYPDHLAMGLGGTKGACSVEDGCGAPRANQQELGFMSENTAEPNTETPNLLRRVLGQLSAVFSSLTSSNELEEAISLELKDSVPGFSWVVDHDPDAGTVLYSTFVGETQRYYRRGFEVDSAGAVTLKDDATEGTTTTEFKPAEANLDTAALADTTAGGGPTNKGDATMTEAIKALIGKLVASKASCFTDADEASLEAFGEERLTAMVTHCEAAEPNPEPKQLAIEPKPDDIVPADTVTLSKEEHADITAAAASFKAQQAAEKTKLVAAIGAATEAYTPEQLEAKDVADLSALALALKVDQPKPDFSARGLAGASADYKAPCAYGLDKEAN